MAQGGSVYQEASKELTDLGSEAQRGITGLISRTRGLSLATGDASAVSADPSSSSSSTTQHDGNSTTPTAESSSKDRGATLTTDEALAESETVLSRLRVEAAKRLRDIQKAEDAADEALLRFGTNIRDFLKDAVSIAPPSGAGGAGADGQRGSSEVLFESKDAAGKRVIHTSRFDAQLHVIHTSTESFTKDPATGDWDTWGTEFDIESRTEDIARDLEKYPELRSTMERLVPETIDYASFWKRYYFLRHGIDIAEARRKELLKGWSPACLHYYPIYLDICRHELFADIHFPSAAASAEEEVGWDEDSDDETAAAAPSPRKAAASEPRRPGSTESSTTIQPPPTNTSALLKPSEPRKSNDERSQADSDTSYDVVGASSGNPSHAPNSPKEARKDDDSDEDWE